MRNKQTILFWEQSKAFIFGFLIGAFISSVGPAKAEPIETISTTNQTVNTNGNMTTTVKSPPPSAISPQISTGSGDLCTVGVAGAVQTQILGISAGTTFTEENCVRLKNAKALYDMGMKVAAVSVMCQEKKIFDAMMMAGTPCPYNGMIGEQAKIGWANHEEKPYETVDKDNSTDVKEVGKDFGLGLLGWLLLL